MEKWKTVVGYEGYYEVSDHGSVRRIGSRQKSLYAQTNGVYQKVCLSKRGVVKQKYIHHLVLEAFVSKRPGKLVACHGDGDVNNNRLDNLRWDTQSNNHLDKIKHGTMPLGDTHKNAVLTCLDVKFIRHWINAGYIGQEIADSFGVSKQTISNIKNNKVWRHV